MEKEERFQTIRTETRHGFLTVDTSKVRPGQPLEEHCHYSVWCAYVCVNYNVQLGVLTPRLVHRGNAILRLVHEQCDSIELRVSIRHARVDFNPPGLPASV